MNHDRKFFDSVADTYVNEWVRSKKKEKRIRNIVREFGIKKGMRVIEAGAGNGQFTPFILEKTDRITLVDVSAKMLAKAKNHLDNRKLKYLRTCVTKLSAKSANPDMIICFNSFPHFYPKDKVLKIFSSMLKKGGKLVISHSADRSYINSMHRGYRFNMKKHSIPSKSEMTSLLDAAGMKIEKYTNRNYYLLVAGKKQNSSTRKDV